MTERLAPEQHDSLQGILEPAENPQLVGHVAAQQMLTGALGAGRLPHALILSGPQGVGKATFAFHLARHLIDAGQTRSANGLFVPHDPISALFRQIASGAHPSVLHLTRPLNDKGNAYKTVIAVDEIRRIGQFLSLTAPDGTYRVVIVDPVDDLRNAAANALLKSLEEPPSRTVFILISHAAGRLLPTIRSRCQIIKFEPLADMDMEKLLSGIEGFSSDADTRAEIIGRSSGSPRAAIISHQHGGQEIVSTLDQVIAHPGDIRLAHRLADVVSGKDNAMRFSLFNTHALDMLARAAGIAATNGNGSLANALADAWQEARIAISDTETYNLDQKQHALTMIGRLNNALSRVSKRM